MTFSMAYSQDKRSGAPERHKGATNLKSVNMKATCYCYRCTTTLHAPTLSGCDGEAVSTRHFGHRLASKGSEEELDSLMFLKVFHTQLSVLVAPEGDQTTTFCKARNLVK